MELTVIYVAVTTTCVCKDPGSENGSVAPSAVPGRSECTENCVESGKDSDGASDDKESACNAGD